MRRAERLPQSDEHLSEERVLQIRVRIARVHDDADDLRPAADERPCGGVWDVVELADAFKDALTRLLAHRRGAVQTPLNRATSRMLAIVAKSRVGGAARWAPPPPSVSYGRSPGFAS